ncbi:hypothetical protein Syun_021390 [Stephania yunnanensis]|uniref:Uncharacterized protein n=1 Tax=Stephania yunnanensis TaxID=152371 RepID=A0AAP0NPQ2_9MAGN
MEDGGILYQDGGLADGHKRGEGEGVGGVFEEESIGACALGQSINYLYEYF